MYYKKKLIFIIHYTSTHLQNMADDSKCSICFNHGKMVIGECCRQSMCTECFDKWTGDNTTCPFCRGEIVKENWNEAKINTEYRINTIIETCLKNGIKRIPIRKEEFNDSIKEYLNRYTEETGHSSKKGDVCICSTNKEYNHYYGFFDAIVVEPEKKAYYRHHLCSDCYSLTPQKLWTKMLYLKKIGNGDSDRYISLLRDKLILYFRGNEKPNIDVIENFLVEYRFKYLGYINKKECDFVRNLLTICSGRIYYYADHMLMKHIDVPVSKTLLTLFSKVFFDNAWEISTEYSGFLGLYPIISLWNIVRSDTHKYRECSEQWNCSRKLLEEWKEDIL